MKNDWIIDVLVDLKKFSARNRLNHLAEHLDDTIMVATTELASTVQAKRHLLGEHEQVDRHAGRAFSGHNA